MAKLIFLGTSSSIPSVRRDNTALLLRYGNTSLLIDCPGSLVQKLSKAHIDFKKIRRVIITHHHIDHYYGLFHLIHAQAYINTKVTIYSNLAVIGLLKTLLKKMDLTRPRYPKIEFKDVFSKKYFYSHGGLTIRAVKNCHVDDSFGTKISFRKKNILYSSDTALCSSVIAQAADCDYLIHDCTASSSYFRRHPRLDEVHTNAKDLTVTFIRSKIKKIIPVHFLLLRKDEEQKIKKELKPFGKRLFFPSDFDVIEF
ncbi:MAG: ribonuclease Z [Candidatus Omnitrophica bacterium]|nr:ribonuclease Z [Candidatus Omnitrophota bacterium]